jgi:hypothetical protein
MAAVREGMKEAKPSVGRPPGAIYPRKFLVYDDDEGIALLGQIARTLGLSRAAAVRLLVREKAQELQLRRAGDERPQVAREK